MKCTECGAWDIFWVRSDLVRLLRGLWRTRCCGSCSLHQMSCRCTLCAGGFGLTAPAVHRARGYWPCTLTLTNTNFYVLVDCGLTAPATTSGPVLLLVSAALWMLKYRSPTSSPPFIIFLWSAIVLSMSSFCGFGFPENIGLLSAL